MVSLRTGRRNSGREKPDFKMLAAGERPAEEDVIEKSFPTPDITMTGEKKSIEETLGLGVMSKGKVSPPKSAQRGLV